MFVGGLGRTPPPTSEEHTHVSDDCTHHHRARNRARRRPSGRGPTRPPRRGPTRPDGHPPPTRARLRRRAALHDRSRRRVQLHRPAHGRGARQPRGHRRHDRHVFQPRGAHRVLPLRGPLRPRGATPCDGPRLRRLGRLRGTVPRRARRRQHTVRRGGVHAARARPPVVRVRLPRLGEHHHAGGASGTAVGWFYVAFTGGLPTLGSLFAIGAIPVFGGGTTGETGAMVASVALVVAGFLVVLFGVRLPNGSSRVAPADEARLARPDERRPAHGHAAEGPDGLPGPTHQHGARVRHVRRPAGRDRRRPRLGAEPLAADDRLRLRHEHLRQRPVRLGRRPHRLAAHGQVVRHRRFRDRTRRLVVRPAARPGGIRLGLRALRRRGCVFGCMLAGFVPMGAIMPALAPAHRGAAMAMYTTAAGGAAFLGTGSWRPSWHSAAAARP